MKLRSVFLYSLIMFLSIGTVQANDTAEARAKAAERYLKSVPMKGMMKNMIEGMSRSVPTDKRKEFISKMNKMINITELEKIARSAMIKTFTADELNALADFYGSKLGKSATSKLGNYMAEVMPAIQQQMMKARQSAIK